MTSARRSACLFLLAFLSACPDQEQGGRLVTNRCTQSFECGKPDTCDSELGICVHRGVERPYSIALQVTPAAVPGGTPLARTTRPVQAVAGGIAEMTIHVRSVVVVAGNVLDENGRSIEAEVAFVASGAGTGYLIGGTSSFTQPQNDDTPSFVALLEPDTAYRVRVFPRAKDSEQLPPREFALTTTSSSQYTNFSYPPQARFSGTLLDESQEPADPEYQVRLRHKVTGEYASSVGKIKSGGTFEIRAPAEVLVASSLSQHELVLKVQRRNEPRLVEIAFAGDRLRPGGTLVMPTLPAPVVFSGTVEVADLLTAKPDENTVNANLTFVSSFEPQPNDVTGGDWCRLRLPGAPQETFSCSATVTASVGIDRKVVANLLPGSYQVFVAPTGDVIDRYRVATTSLEETIGIQPNGMQEGRVFRLSRAVRYSGTVLSPALKPMPTVTITANALGLRGDLPEVAAYNRTAAQVSDRQGGFQLAVDTGFYDLIAAPPEDSGFSWVLLDNRRIREQDGLASTGIISPQIPVIARGQVQTGDNKPVTGALVEAFAIVPDTNPDRPGQRAVRIARANSDAQGRFALLLPQCIGELNGCPKDGDMAITQAMPDASAPDASVSDAGVPDAGPQAHDAQR